LWEYENENRHSYQKIRSGKCGGSPLDEIMNYTDNILKETTMNENIIFFFSGTGNSFDIALRMAEKLKSTTIVNIASIKKMPSLGNYKRIGFVFPVYGFTMPNIVAKFISQLPQNTDAYYFSIVTLGGFELGAKYRIYEAFNKKGITINYITQIYMPENYILFSIVPGDSLIKKHLRNSIKRIQKTSNEILDLRTLQPKKSIFYHLVENISREETKKWPLMAKEFIVNDNCIKCGKCIKICPVDNIKMLEGKIMFEEHCECCLACMHSCQKAAINYGIKTVGKERYINPNIKIEDLKKY
jgi:ferredoxin/flavodoxin